MTPMPRTAALRGLVIAVVLVLALGACGDDGNTMPTGDVGGIEGSVSDDDLLVSRDYLQGEWCEGDDKHWTIEGDIAHFDDGSGATAEVPIDILFIDGVGVDLISQTDDMFVFGSATEQATFTRGSC